MEKALEILRTALLKEIQDEKRMIEENRTYDLPEIEAEFIELDNYKLEVEKQISFTGLINAREDFLGMDDEAHLSWILDILDEELDDSPPPD